MLLFMTSAYYIRQYLTKKQETNKCQEKIVAKPSQVQTVTISTSNQNIAAPTNFPDLPKLDLAGFGKGMIMINALFCAHPKSFRDAAQNIMMMAAQLKDDVRETFLTSLEEDPDLIFSYNQFLERMNSATTPAGAKTQAYMGLIRLTQGRDDLETYIQQFLHLADAPKIPDDISGLHFRNGLNPHHTSLMRHH
ncbi:hypothetical protein DSO57_1039676 [Entomophthora muscae]|uniref:Uncharacterized protein n=1 Tax=Entomophthora muscae TaxID=34485 RepID=A0ACC2RM53_9FUNG|nr:hypothetical protein DSO57_1039676 [Entomophthora muscae]